MIIFYSCKFKFKDGSEYKGEWLKGNYHGKGKFVTNTGAAYEGDWIKGTF